jgi:hypothetical protein
MARPRSIDTRRARATATVGRGDRGSVTVEAALALCGLALVVAMAIGAVATVAASLRCTDAARELARLAARGEADRGRAVAARLAPMGARIVLQIRGDEAVAEVTAPPVRLLPVHVRGKAVAMLEPGVAPALDAEVHGNTPPEGAFAPGIAPNATPPTPGGPPP